VSPHCVSHCVPLCAPPLTVSPPLPWARCDSLVPGLHAIMQSAVERGVHHVDLGMSHRGRLNILVNLLHKPASLVFAEMDGQQARPRKLAV
jgi:hypothetical protein